MSYHCVSVSDSLHHTVSSYLCGVSGNSSILAVHLPQLISGLLALDIIQYPVILVLLLKWSSIVGIRMKSAEQQFIPTALADSDLYSHGERGAVGTMLRVIAYKER